MVVRDGRQADRGGDGDGQRWAVMGCCLLRRSVSRAVMIDVLLPRVLDGDGWRWQLASGWSASVVGSAVEVKQAMPLSDWSAQAKKWAGGVFLVGGGGRRF
ncbi:hypothetical protein Dimus_025218 [Dionaea muscipula]